MWKVTKEFSFEAAHSLPHLPPEHKCHHLHGHSYRFVVVCRGDLIPDRSWVVDYADITAAVNPILAELDHKNLNDVLCIHTTAENLAYWLFRRLMGPLPSLVAKRDGDGKDGGDLRAMTFLCGQSNRVWHYRAGRQEAMREVGAPLPHEVGLLISPEYMNKVPLDPWMPYALDNGAFGAWRDGRDWDEPGWFGMLRKVAMMRLKRAPLWCAVPDSVGNPDATLTMWDTYARHVKDLGWPAAFCVQDGAEPDDVPADADAVFVGGTDRWKFPNLALWSAFPRVHCGRVNSPEMFEACERCGCESVDGTGWFRDPSRPDKLKAVLGFIDGRRNETPMLFT